MLGRLSTPTQRTQSPTCWISRWNVAHGGCTEALRRHAHGTCKWFTVFRHPIARLVSAFYHCRESPGDPLCASEGAGAGGMDLVHFAEHWGNYALRQFALAGGIACRAGCQSNQRRMMGQFSMAMRGGESVGFTAYRMLSLSLDHLVQSTKEAHRFRRDVQGIQSSDSCLQYQSQDPANIL